MIADFKYAIRMLLKTPGFTAIAIITLGLGMGAATSIFSVVDAVLLRPLPYPEQERIVELRELSETGRPMPFAEPNINDLRARSHSFEAVTNYSVWPRSVAGGSEPVRTNVCAASREFFRVLGVTPLIGRYFSEQPGSGENEVVVVSYGFWKSLLGGRTNLDGMALRFENRSFAVIGVLPPDVEFPPKTDVWFPADIYPSNDSRTAHNWRAAARLGGGVSPEQAAAEIAAIGQQLRREFGSQTDAVSFSLAPLRERMVKDLRGVLLVICAAVGLLVLIACSNAANLLLVRVTARRKEIALRSALGASRGRLARQFIAEALLLTLAAGAVGVLLAFWSVDLIVGLYSGNLPGSARVAVNTTVLMFTLAVTVVTGLVLGFVPALHTSRRQLQTDLQEGGRGQSASRGNRRMRDGLVVAQIGLTLMLLVAAGLLGRSFQRLLKVDPGFQTESAVAMTVSMPQPEEAASQRQLAQFYQQLLARLEVLPGVASVGGINAPPMSGMGANGTFIVQSGSKPAQTMQELKQQLDALSPAERSRDAEYRVASAGYFRVMGIPLIRGRLFGASDGPDSPHLAVISNSFAKRYWPNEDPIGKQIQFGNMDGDLRLLNIVGIVGDVRDEGLDVDIRPTIYTNYLQRPAAAAQFSFVVRGQGDPATLIAAMRREAAAANSEMPVRFETLKQIVSSSLDNRRFSMVILAVFAGAALVLAMVGLYGVMAYITSERTSEIGIRMALGAQRADVLWLVLRQSLVFVCAGIVAGIVTALATTRVLAALLYGISAADVLTYGAVVLLLGLAALGATFVPARRAMRVDPMVALRYE
jgi:predicted permease